MKLEIINPENLTLSQAIKEQYSLYYIRENHLGVSTFSLVPFDKEGLALPKDEFLLVKLTSETDQVVENIHEIIPDSDVKVKEPAPKTYSPRERRTYKIDSWDEHKIIEVESRPDGAIRCNFKDKDSAQIYFEYIREMFYMTSSSDLYLSVSTIYDELKVVNWDHEKCDDWGWPMLDGGQCRYISPQVLKTKNKNMWGFTLNAPQKIYV